MDTRHSLNTPVARAVALALAMSASSATWAQNAPADTLEEVVVTGIRASLTSAVAVKRNATGVVEAINAEEMGKFPEQNLAEALARIPGVSIDRFNEEGSKITVRGMGPEFNLVTLNGRSMPTAGGRSFDFNDIATEGISAVEVFKTAKAYLPTGGIGATVDIRTARPLDEAGFHGAFSAKGVHENSASKSSIRKLHELTPEISGIVSDTFADDKFGVLLSGAYQKRDNREENAAVDNWCPSYQCTGGNNNPFVAGTVENNNKRADGVYWHPQNIGYGWADITRTRTNGQAVLQWAPTDRVTATLDYTYSKLELLKDANSVGIWFAGPNVDAVINERGTVTQVTQNGGSPGDWSTNIARDHTIKENNSVGFNVTFKATDNLALNLDAHSSSSKFGGAGIGGEPASSENLIIGNTSCPWCAGAGPGFGPNTATIDQKTGTFSSSGVPIMNATFIDGNGNPIGFPGQGDIGSLFGQAFNTKQKNGIDQIQLGGKWKNAEQSPVKSVDFGYGYTKQTFDQQNAYSNNLPAGYWLTSAQYWQNGVLQKGSFAGLLSNFSGANQSLNSYYTVPFDTAVRQFETIGTNDPINVYWPSWGPTFQNADHTAGRFWPGPLGPDSRVEETISSFYTQMVMQDSFKGMPINAVLGIRYEDSSTRSYGQEIPATGIQWAGGNEFAYTFGAPVTAEGRGKTRFWLPSLDVDMALSSAVKARFSYSRSIARPPIGALSPTRDFSAKPNNNARSITVGNPNLLPYVSDNFDLSLEWYYAPGSYVSVGYYTKRVNNFLVGSTTQQTIAGITDPYIGAAATQARAELAAAGAAITDQAVFDQINTDLGQPAGTHIAALPTDPLAVFTVGSTANQKVGNLHGVELAMQHMFGRSGFGIQANVTIVGGDVNADRNVIRQSFALPGLSNSANVTGFYENKRVSTRLAYNRRDEFLSGFDQFGSPVYQQKYGQLDYNATWKTTDNLAVFFEAINLTHQTQRTYVRYPEQFLRGNQYGTRFNIGARYRF
ncbi:MAG: TonB-dependent receptor [Pseudomonadota bacterium]